MIVFCFVFLSLPIQSMQSSLFLPSFFFVLFFRWASIFNIPSFPQIVDDPRPSDPTYERCTKKLIEALSTRTELVNWGLPCGVVWVPSTGGQIFSLELIRFSREDPSFLLPTGISLMPILGAQRKIRVGDTCLNMHKVYFHFILFSPHLRTPVWNPCPFWEQISNLTPGWERGSQSILWSGDGSLQFSTNFQSILLFSARLLPLLPEVLKATHPEPLRSSVKALIYHFGFWFS